MLSEGQPPARRTDDKIAVNIEQEEVIMFIATTYPPIFEHSIMTSTMTLRTLSRLGTGRSVALVRTLRDGSVTHEYLPEYLAELVVAMIPFDEPLVASARIAYS